jgi:hypothetical protein
VVYIPYGVACHGVHQPSLTNRPAAVATDHKLIGQSCQLCHVTSRRLYLAALCCCMLLYNMLQPQIRSGGRSHRWEPRRLIPACGSCLELEGNEEFLRQHDHAKRHLSTALCHDISHIMDGQSGRSSQLHACKGRILGQYKGGRLKQCQQLSRPFSQYAVPSCRTDTS